MLWEGRGQLRAIPNLAYILPFVFNKNFLTSIIVFQLNEESLEKAKQHVWKKRLELSEIFGYKCHISKKGLPLPWLKKRIKNNILKDPKLYVLKRMLRS